MIPLGNFIDAELKKAAARVYNEQAPENKEFPYVTYTFPNSLDSERREDFVLEVNVWDKVSILTSTPLELEQIADAISEQLHMARYVTGNMATTIYRMNRLAPRDPDPNIRRRILRFECKTYFLKG